MRRRNREREAEIPTRGGENPKFCILNINQTLSVPIDSSPIYTEKNIIPLELSEIKI